MAIRDLQSTLAEMGRIRLGQRVPKASGNGLRPAKLDVFKFTSAAEHLITEIAALYGGKVEPFTGEGVRGKQFMVLTETNDIPVYVPQQKIDPFYESWAGGVCTRRCDGERDHIHDNPCDCNPEKRACKPTTRVKVMLADVPGLGVWRLETHGIYAAMELSQLASFIERVPVPLPGRLILQSRMRKFFNRAEGKVETRDYYVPVLDVSSVTFRQLAVGGDALSQALSTVAPAMAELDSTPRPPAIEAAPAAQAEPDPKVIERGLALIASATAEQLPDLRERIVKMGSPQVLVEAWRKRSSALLAERAKQPELASVPNATPFTERSLTPELRNELEEQAEYDAARAGEQFEGAWDGEEVATPPAEGPAAAVGEPPAGDDMGERSAAMMELLGVAGKLKISTKLLDSEFTGRYGVARTSATAGQLRELAAFLLERNK